MTGKRVDRQNGTESLPREQVTATCQSRSAQLRLVLLSRDAPARIADHRRGLEPLVVGALASASTQNPRTLRLLLLQVGHSVCRPSKSAKVARQRRVASKGSLDFAQQGFQQAAGAVFVDEDARD